MSCRPVKDTPVLTGKEAARFTEIIKLNETRKVPPEDFRRAMDVYRRIIAKAG